MSNHDLAKLVREARYGVLSDSEAWASMVQQFEFVGRALAKGSAKNGNGLYSFKTPIFEVIAAYFTKIEDNRSVKEAEIEFGRIIELRNDSIHNGANARNLAHTCVSFGSKLEEALMGDSKTVSGVMVSNPSTVSEGDPVAMARRLMIVNSFTNIPVQCSSGEWKLLSDTKIARYRSSFVKKRGEMMFRSIAEAFPGLNTDENSLPDAKTIESDRPLNEIWPLIDSGLVVVLEKGRLVGVVSAFDLL